MAKKPKVAAEPETEGEAAPAPSRYRGAGTLAREAEREARKQAQQERAVARRAAVEASEAAAREAARPVVETAVRDPETWPNWMRGEP